MLNYNVKITDNALELTGNGLEYLINLETQSVAKYFHGEFINFLTLDLETDNDEERIES